MDIIWDVWMFRRKLLILFVLFWVGYGVGGIYFLIRCWWWEGWGGEV